MAFEKFCFCCKLHKGAFIWGVLSIIADAILLITTVSSNIFLDRIYDGNTLINDAVDIMYSHNIPINTTYRTTPVFWTITVISIITLISSILLVIGVVKV